MLSLNIYKQKKYLLSFIIFFFCHIVKAQCPVPDFIFPNTLCINQSFVIENNSTGALEYEWDFCAGDLTQIPAITGTFTNILYKNLSNITIVSESSKWFGFVASRGNRKLIRLDFEEGLWNNPQIKDLGVLNSGFSQPIDIELFKEGDIWYGLLVDAGTNKLW